MMKTNKSRFTEDDIRRNLPPDVFSLLHDLAYLNPHRSSLRQSVISFINGARSLLRKPSTDDVNDMLTVRESFVLDRCCDALCVSCAEGVELKVQHATSESIFLHCGETCGAQEVHRLRQRWERQREQAAKFNASAVVEPPKHFDCERPNAKMARELHDAEGRN